MPQSTVLVIDANEDRYLELRDAISAITVHPPVHHTTGESAVLWAGANACDVCVVAYELPGIDGLETIARIRNRKPEIPVILISESSEQHIAVSAFRSGVADFVRAVPGCGKEVGGSVKRLLGTGESTVPDSPMKDDPTLADIPAPMLRPTYQNRLRVIGRQLDIYRYRSVVLVEVDGGFMVRGLQERSRKPDALEFPDRDFPWLVRASLNSQPSGQDKPKPTRDLLPTGYEDFLRALGYRMDESRADGIVVAELVDQVVVTGRGEQGATLGPALKPFQWFLMNDDIEFMLDEAFRRRGSTPSAKPDTSGKDPESTGFRSILKRLN